MLVALVAAAASAAAAGSVSPIAEYEPTRSVLFPEELFAAGYHAPELVAAVTAAGAEVIIVTSEPRDAAARKALFAEAGKADLALRFLTVPHGNIWLRDYGPILVRDAQSAAPRFLDAKYDDTGADNDGFPTALGKAVGIQAAALPAALDGGNLLVAGDVCITSVGPATPELSPTTRAALGCRETITLRNPPHAHVDMWIKVVGKDTVLVNQLGPETLKTAAGPDGRMAEELERTRDRLDAGARELAKSLKVERLPMPLPYRGVFRTFANSLLVNQTAITPRFERWGWGHDDYPDAALEPGYERAVREIYARHGYETVFVLADGLLYNGGGFHCVLLQLPSGVTVSAASDPRQKKG